MTKLNKSAQAVIAKTPTEKLKANAAYLEKHQPLVEMIVKSELEEMREIEMAEVKAILGDD